MRRLCLQPAKHSTWAQLLPPSLSPPPPPTPTHPRPHPPPPTPHPHPPTHPPRSSLTDLVLPVALTALPDLVPGQLPRLASLDLTHSIVEALPPSWCCNMQVRR